MPIAGLVQIVVEQLGEFQKLRPQDLVDHRTGGPQHDRGCMLAREPIRMEVVPTVEGDEELALPGIVCLEFVFCERLWRSSELGLKPLQGAAGGLLFTG